MEKEKDINRIKVVLVEKKRTNKWLAKQLEKDPATVSKWCTNTSQPSLETLLRISQILEVDIRELLISSKTIERLYTNYEYIRYIQRNKTKL